MFAILELILILILDFNISRKIDGKVKLNFIVRIIMFIAGSAVIYITCISTSRYTKFNLKNDNNCITGNVLTPVLGGGTSLPEFEVLTGLSSYFIEKQIYP